MGKNGLITVGDGFGGGMWAHEQSIETSARPEQIWRLWANVAGWPGWNADIERIELVGPFAPGSMILMTPIGEEPVEFRIAEAVEPELFVDEADMGEILIRTIHRVERIDADRAQVTYRMEITGPDADTLGPQIGPRSGPTFRRYSPGWRREPRKQSNTDGQLHETISPQPARPEEAQMSTQEDFVSRPARGATREIGV